MAVLENNIVVEGISKSYGMAKALDNVSFAASKGEIFALIGPDGAGKSTLFRILTTLILPDSGSAYVAGFDVVKQFKEIRKNVGYMPGRFSLYQDLSVKENLTLFATLFGTTIFQNKELIAPIYKHIERFSDRKASDLSGGMKQKLALCCALIHRPDVLFLDEPTTGVDPVSRREFWDMLLALKCKGVTILVSTPYMDETRLCDRVALLKKGKLLTIDTPEGLKSKFGEKLYAVRGENMGAMLISLRKIRCVRSAFSFGDSHHVIFGGEPDQLLVELLQQGFTNVQITSIEPGIEDCYMKLAAEND